LRFFAAISSIPWPDMPLPFSSSIFSVQQFLALPANRAILLPVSKERLYDISDNHHFCGIMPDKTVGLGVSRQMKNNSFHFGAGIAAATESGRFGSVCRLRGGIPPLKRPVIPSITAIPAYF
jgi:hypothetical protein